MNRREFVASGAALSQAAGRFEPPNEAIAKARAAALALLKPTASQLQRGLELHAASVIIEPYGFAPRAAWDGDAVKRAYEAGASGNDLENLMDEMENTRFVPDDKEREEFVAAWRSSGVTCIFQNAGQEGQAPLKLLRRLGYFTYALDMMRDFIVRVVDVEDILLAKRSNRAAMALSTNGVPLEQRWETVPSEMDLIRTFFHLGVRMMHLTYNRRNMIGDGCAEPSDAGLSDFGRSVVAEMNRTGIIVDVAHSGQRTSFEAAQASSKPMVASHTSCYALHNHYRAKSDRVIKAIADTGGFVGICAVADFIGRSHDLTSMLDHIDYVVQKFGVNHVAIATDYSYRSQSAGREHRKIPARRRLYAGWEAFWPTRIASYPAGQETMAWTNWPIFSVGLVQRGYSDADIQKILGGNALRVMKAVFPPRPHIP